MKINLALPANLPADSYYIITQITAPTIVQNNPADNITYTDQTIDVTAPFVDLSGSFDVNIADQIIGSGTGTGSVNVVNQGNVAAVGKMNITLYASSDGTYDPTSNTVVGTLTGTAVNLQPYQDKTYQVKVTMPATLAPDDYYFFAVVDSGNKFGTGSRTDNILLAPETTTLVAPTIALDGELGSFTLNNTGDLIPGTTGAAVVTVSNDGNSLAVGKITVCVYASSDGSLDSGSILLGTSKATSVKIQPNGSANVNVSLLLPKTMPADSYYIFTQVTAPTVTQSDTSGNVTLADQIIDVAAPFVDLTGSFNMNIADQIIGSGSGTAYVNVVNQGNVAAVGKMNITLCPPTTGPTTPPPTPSWAA